MLSITTFLNGDKNASSERDSNKGISFSREVGSQFGGVTFKNGNMISRFDNSGVFMGSEMRFGNGHTIYTDSSGGITDRLKEFVR